MVETLRILIAGDGLCRAEIYERYLRESFARTPFTLAITASAVDWPEAPLQTSGEVEEWVGSDEEIASLAGDVDAIVTQVAPITRRVFQAAPSLRAVACSRNVPVNVNVEEATRRNIPVLCAPGRNAQAVAEFTVALALCELKNIARAHELLRQGTWRTDLYRYERAGRQVHGLTVGLVGFGAIGSRVAAYFRALDMQVLVHDPYVPDEVLERVGVPRADDLDHLLRRSDVVSLHSRVTPETRGLIGRRELSLMKSTAILINTARGPLVDYEALYEALSDGSIAGAALDTFATEPLEPGSPLLALPNVTLTPHIGGSSQETAHDSAELVAADLRRVFSDEVPIHCSNWAQIRGRTRP